MYGPIYHEHPWGVMPHFYFYRDLEETEKEEQATTKKAVTKEELLSEWTLLAPMSTAS